jgi:catechol 2,3-dioxygenase-like lactoylglutathione lyase family enzyme
MHHSAMTIDHVTINVKAYERSKRFYERSLATLGLRVVTEYEMFCGFGRDKPDFWIGQGPANFQRPEHLSPITPIHIAFRAKSRAEVDAFYQAALASGGSDNGAPGVRQYHPNYYGAFVLDPDGHNVEAVFHG